jgi:hypothetical protein
MENNVIEAIQNRFFEALKAKNSWGKNEVEMLYLVVSNKVMTEFISSQK